jgi:hypothetical protein
MKIIEFIDFCALYKKVKESQLEQFPTADDYIEELKSCDLPFDYVEGMYHYFTHPPEDAELSSTDEWGDADALKLDEGHVLLEWTIGGNNATENGDDFWGYGWIFTIDLETELFIGYTEENYS